MLNRTSYIIFLLLLIVVYSCQQSLIKKDKRIAEVDSSLFFEQVEIEDPFLNKLANNPSQTFTLKKTLIPPPLPESEQSKFRTIEGYRVQIFAGIDSIYALSNKNIAKGTVMDTVYMFRDKGLFKLQVGDYPYYPQADSIKRQFRQTHFPGAWIVRTNILIPFQESGLDAMVDSVRVNNSGKYKIQVIATSDENKAENIVNSLKLQYNFNSFYESAGNIYKVFIGYFNNEDQARNALEIIRKGKYPDAWLVY
jgi:hypothetical protein